MELLQLEYFYAVAQNQHMTRTAEQLHIAQPSLTQSIRRLEKELGVPLFYRSGRNIALTTSSVMPSRRQPHNPAVFPLFPSAVSWLPRQ